MARAIFNMDKNTESAYRAAYESAAAKKWIESLPPATRKRAAELGLLKPYLDPPIFSTPLRLFDSPSSQKASFDESDFAFAAVESGGNLDGMRANFHDDPEESPEE